MIMPSFEECANAGFTYPENAYLALRNDAHNAAEYAIGAHKSVPREVEVRAFIAAANECARSDGGFSLGNFSTYAVQSRLTPNIEAIKAAYRVLCAQGYGFGGIA